MISKIIHKPKSKINKSTLTFFSLKSFIVLLSMLSTYFVYIKTNSFPGYSLLFLLPFTYGILFFIFPALSRFWLGNIGLTILNGVVFIRFVISPFLHSMSIHDGTFRGYSPTPSGINTGIRIIIIELIVTFLIVQIFAKRFYNKKNTNREFKPLSSKIVLKGTTLIGISLLLAFPEIITRYNFFIISDDIVKLKSDFPLSGLLFLITDLLLVIIPILLLNFFKIRYEKHPTFLYVFLSMLAVSPAMMIFKGTSRFSVLVPSVAWLIILLKLYPKYKKSIIATLTSLLIIVFISITLYKQFGYTQGDEIKPKNMNEIAYNFDAYFSGPDNMARAVDLKQSFGNYIDLNTMKNDIINNVVLISRFSDSENTSAAWFNYLFYGVKGKVDQIIPLSGQSYLYFGAIGMPLLLTITLILMMFFDSKIKNENRIEFVYIYVYLVFYLSMGMMVSFGSIYPLFTNLAIPVLLIFYFNRKITI